MPGQQTLTLTLRNDLTEITRIADEIEAFGEAHGWAMQWIYNTNLALDELITNSISYGALDDRDDAIRVTLRVDDGTLTVVMEDDGAPFNPFEEAPVPDLDADVDDRNIGGLGVFFVKTIASDYNYQRIDGINRVTLVQESKEQ